MALRTNNSYGTITVSDDVIASLGGASWPRSATALWKWCLSVFPTRFTDLFKRNGKSRGVTCGYQGGQNFR